MNKTTGADRQTPLTRRAFIIGGTKCGTTYLYNVLNSIGIQGLPSIKEPHFFTENSDKGSRWYESLYKSNEGILFDFSADYVYDISSINQILEYDRDPVFILLVRNPFDRSLSQLIQLSRFTKMDVENLVKSEYHRIIERSFISKYIEEIISVVPRERLFIYTFDDLVTDPKNIVRQLLRDVGENTDGIDLINTDVDQGSGFLPRSIFLEKCRTALYQLSLNRHFRFLQNPKFRNLARKIYRSYFTRKIDKMKFRREFVPLFPFKQAQLEIGELVKNGWLEARIGKSWLEKMKDPKDEL